MPNTLRLRAAPRVADAGVEPRPRTKPFRWSWRFATITGIDVYVHGTFFLLVAFLVFADLYAGRPVLAILRSTLLLSAVFGAVVLHEFGHALAARWFGIGTRDITLLPIGGIARLDRMPDVPSHQLVVAAAGPLVNLAIAVALAGLIALEGGQLTLSRFRYDGGSFIAQLMWLNAFLAAFNLLPGYPMDGGRILRALLAMVVAPERATQIAARVGQATAAVFAVVGLFVSPFLVLIAVFIWFGARSEHSISIAREALAGLAVREGMITDFQTLGPDDALARAVELSVAGFQQDFPVVDDRGVLVGALAHGDLLRGLSERGPESSVRRAMDTRRLEAVAPSDGLDGALMRIHQTGCRVLMVLDDGDVVGLLTMSNVGELIAMEAAGRHVVSPHEEPELA